MYSLCCGRGIKSFNNGIYLKVTFKLAIFIHYNSRTFERQLKTKQAYFTKIY